MSNQNPTLKKGGGNVRKTRWVQDEVNKLLAMAREEKSWKEIGEKLGRTPMACKLKYLKLKGRIPQVQKKELRLEGLDISIGDTRLWLPRQGARKAWLALKEVMDSLFEAK
jgi:hypothetical protein